MNDTIAKLPLGVAWLLGVVVAWSSLACSDKASDANRTGTGGALNTGGAIGSGGVANGTGGVLGAEAGTGGAVGDPSEFANCSKGILEADRDGDATLAGPGVNPETGVIAPRSYIVATTYLALKPEQAARALEFGGAVVQSLFSMKGFVAFSTTQSSACAALRTLTIWESEEDMLAFVTSPAHLAAMSHLPELSRGTSNTIAWEGTEQDATWERAVMHLASETGGDR